VKIREVRIRTIISHLQEKLRRSWVTLKTGKSKYPYVSYDLGRMLSEVVFLRISTYIVKCRVDIHGTAMSLGLNILAST
jgi:hypothetical protein